MKVKQGKSFVSAQRVAELAGVSRSAVSRTFTDGASVSSNTRSKVLAAAETLGYHVNHLARGLINENSNIVCILAADIDAPYHARFIETLTRQLQAAGKITMIVNTSGDVGAHNALRQTLHYRADASIVLSGQPDQQLIETCLNNGQRVIEVNREQTFDGAEHIGVSNRESSRQAFHMLHRAGCRNIAVVASNLGTPSLVARETAFVDEACDTDATVSITRTGTTSYGSGAEIARQLFSQRDRPDGAFAVTDLLACGFMDAARNEFGISVPEELSIIGFDDIEQAGWSAYSLTTFRQPLEEISAHIVGLVEGSAQAEGETPMRFVTKPVWRTSVRKR